MVYDDVCVLYDVVVECVVDVGLCCVCYGVFVGGVSVFIFLCGLCVCVVVFVFGVGVGVGSVYEDV